MKKDRCQSHEILRVSCFDLLVGDMLGTPWRASAMHDIFFCFPKIPNFQKKNTKLFGGFPTSSFLTTKNPFKLI